MALHSPRHLRRWADARRNTVLMRHAVQDEATWPAASTVALHSQGDTDVYGPAPFSVTV